MAQFLLKSGRDYIEVPKGFPKQYPYNLISSKSIKNHIDPFARNLLSTSKVAGKKKLAEFDGYFKDLSFRSPKVSPYSFGQRLNQAHINQQPPTPSTEREVFGNMLPDCVC